VDNDVAEDTRTTVTPSASGCDTGW